MDGDDREDRLVSFTPLNSAFKTKRLVNVDTPIMIGRLVDGQEQSSNNLKFNSKVVSRQHAMIFYENGKLYIQDTKSSSGTFLNGQRLSLQGQESPLVEIHDGDIIKLGEDCELNGVLHQCITMKVGLPNQNRTDAGSSDSGLENEDGAAYVDYSLDPEVRANVDSEFNQIWSSLTQGLETPLQRLRSLNEELIKRQQQQQQTLSDVRRAVSASQDGTSTSEKRTSGHGGSNQIQPAQLATSMNPISLDLAGSSGATTIFALKSSDKDKMRPDSTQDVNLIKEMVTFVENQSWEKPFYKKELIDLAKSFDSQFVSYYKTLHGFPQAFINVATKYVDNRRESRG